MPQLTEDHHEPVFPARDLTARERVMIWWGWKEDPDEENQTGWRRLASWLWLIPGLYLCVSAVVHGDWGAIEFVVGAFVVVSAGLGLWTLMDRWRGA